MITAALSYVLMPSNFFFFFKIVLSFAFHINYKINLLISTKKTTLHDIRWYHIDSMD